MSKEIIWNERTYISPPEPSKVVEKPTINNDLISCQLAAMNASLTETVRRMGLLFGQMEAMAATLSSFNDNLAECKVKP
jgi:hypothetical protein